MIDLTEIKKLPNEEKWIIIEEIEASMTEENETSDSIYEENLNQLLADRLTAHQRGETASYTWEEVQNRLEAVRKKANAPQNA